jgi:hypothetical protein
MKLSLKLKGIILGAISALAAIGIAFAAGEIFQHRPTAASGAAAALVIPPEVLRPGLQIVHVVCPCHGAEARGDEGPVAWRQIWPAHRHDHQNGIKGEMQSLAPNSMIRRPGHSLLSSNVKKE